MLFRCEHYVRVELVHFPHEHKPVISKSADTMKCVFEGRAQALAVLLCNMFKVTTCPSYGSFRPLSPRPTCLDNATWMV